MEGPSIVILKEELGVCVGKRMRKVSGSASVELETLEGLTIKRVLSFGKELLIDCSEIVVRVHFLMFGSYRINERKEGRVPRLSFKAGRTEVNFYSCSVRFVEGKLKDNYDWRADIMSSRFDLDRAVETMQGEPARTLDDVLLDQLIFAGSGNIIKNEVLLRTGYLPQRTVRSLGKRKVRALAKEVVKYSTDFYNWKKAYVLKKNWKIYRKRICPSCDSKVAMKHTGKGQRLSFYCKVCQS